MRIAEIFQLGYGYDRGGHGQGDKHDHDGHQRKHHSGDHRRRHDGGGLLKIHIELL